MISPRICIKKNYMPPILTYYLALSLMVIPNELVELSTYILVWADIINILKHYT